MAALVLLVTSGIAAGPANAQQFDLDSFPVVALESMSTSHRQWLERDVRWIITPDESNVFVRLPDAARRDAFVEEFWRRRDPTPGTRANEFRDQHFARLAYATRIYGRGSPRPGWMTDRGRIHILLGEPRTISRFENTQMAWPVESWFYDVDPASGLPGFFYVAFFKKNGVGDYRLYSPLADGPEALLNPSGQMHALNLRNDDFARPRGRATPYGDLGNVVEALRTVDMELAEVSISLIPGDGASLSMSPVRSEMLLAQIENIPYEAMRDTAWAFRMLAGETTARVRFETLPVETTATALLDPQGRAFVHYALRAPAAQLNFSEYSGEQRLTFELGDSLSDAQARLLDSPTPLPIEVVLDPARASQLRQGPLTLIERMPAIPGRFTLGLVLENTVSGEFGRAEVDVDVPGPNPATLGASVPFLVTEYEDLGANYDPFAEHFAFQLGRNFVMPAFDGPFARDSTVWLFQQFHVPATAAAPLPTRYDVVDPAGTIVATKDSTVPLQNRDDHGSLNQLVGIDLAGVPVGNYEVVVRPSDARLGPWRLPLRISADAIAEAFIHADPQPPVDDPGLLLDWARQHRALGQTAPAEALARRALIREPESAEALEMLSALLLDSGQFAELQTLLQPRLARTPNDRELLVVLADTAARSAQHADAIRFYERARIAGEPDTPTLLNKLAGEYAANGDPESARALIEQSLELEPQQPSMRRLLESLTGS